MRVAALALGLALAAGPARAQDTLDDAQRAAAAEAFDAGVTAFAAGELEEARARFAEAFAISDHSVALYNLAETQHRMGRLLEAEVSLTTLVERADLDESRLAQARWRLEAVRAAIPTLSVTIVNLEPDDAVRLDGTTIVHESLTSLRLDPGRHTLEVERRGAFHRAEAVELAAGRSRELELRVPARLAPAPQAPAPAPVPLEAPRDDVGPSYGESWLHAMLGAAIGMAGGVLLGSLVSAIIACSVTGASACGPIAGYVGLITGATLAPAGAGVGAWAFGRLAEGRGDIALPIVLAYVGGLIALPFAFATWTVTEDLFAGLALLIPMSFLLTTLFGALGHSATQGPPPPVTVTAAPLPGGAAVGLGGAF